MNIFCTNITVRNKQKIAAIRDINDTQDFNSIKYFKKSY